VCKHYRSFRATHKRDINREQALDAGMAALFVSGGDDTPSASVVAREERERLQAALERLPADQNQVLVLRTWQQLPFEEIGTLMNRSPDAARKLWARAVEGLGRELRQSP
jgi:RNA polymerase sigma-70 factor (ECF subfamily)